MNLVLIHPGLNGLKFSKTNRIDYFGMIRVQAISQAQHLIHLSSYDSKRVSSCPLILHVCKKLSLVLDKKTGIAQSV
jgi:hypothetical protein